MGSNDVWATVNYGNPNTIAFFVSYFLVPLTCVSVFFAVVFIYYKQRNYLLFVSLTLAFSVAQIFYFPRTIVYHNLTVCSGRAGVLLNFTHWTVALAVLLICCFYKLGYAKKILFFLASFFIVVIFFEGAIVTQFLPTINSCLASTVVVKPANWNVKTDLSQFKGKKRIIFEHKSEELINKFKSVFDSILESDETFIDYANVTSIYALTNRNRPCYVGQTPSLLTNLYSQDCYLKEIESFKCPLAIIGTTNHSHTSHMIGIPHNVRYYKIAEYLWSNYRPLLLMNDFAIWCQKDKWVSYRIKAKNLQNENSGIRFIDYGYDVIEESLDSSSIKNLHNYDLQQLPFIWGNLDQLKSWDTNTVLGLKKDKDNKWRFAKSRDLVNKIKNLEIYINNKTKFNQKTTVFLQEDNLLQSRLRYIFEVQPGLHRYIIRPSQDYLWHAYNINSLWLSDSNNCEIDKARVIDGK